MFEVLFEEYFFKPAGLFAAFILCIFICLPFVPKKDEAPISFYIACFACLIAYIVYAVIYILHNRLPKVKVHNIGVLFVIRAQTDKLFEDAKYNIEKQVSQVTQAYEQSIEPVFCNAQKLSGFNISNDKLIQKYLVKTNAVLCIEVDYNVDDVDNVTQYDVKINTRIMNNPNREFYEQEIKHALIPIEHTQFVKSQKIEKLSFTANVISIMIVYIVGIASFINGDDKKAIDVFDSLQGNSDVPSCLIDRLNYWGFTSCNDYLYVLLESYYNTFEKSGLDLIEGITLRMNSYIQNSLSYLGAMAIIQFSKYRNIAEAKKYVQLWSKTSENITWLYSDAFLTAYSTTDKEVIYQKYLRAVKLDYNPLLITKFIENVLEDEPEKRMLHFALAIVYDSIDDFHLAAQHLSAGSFVPDKKKKMLRSDKFIKHYSSLPECINCEKHEGCTECNSFTKRLVLKQ